MQVLTEPQHRFADMAMKQVQVEIAHLNSLLVQAEAGLLVSYRGALVFDQPVLSPVLAPIPCTNCAKPCLPACPVNALKGKEYDVKACIQYIKKDPKQRCLNSGCLARLACPISANYPRSTEQSAYHMRQFLK